MTLNQNNVTRTKAYLEFYLLFPEVHWAFLGHMVSRNGGWNMTDLRGEFLSRLMDEKTKREFFSFLERGNWLIFQDAYPQFLLFEESVKQRKNLFYLLPYFHVSTFMEVVWNYYWFERNQAILTRALIVNEQNYLEMRVVQNSVYKDKVLKTFEFVLQDLLSFNHILFPFTSKESYGKATALIGLTLHHFESLHERIVLGRRLYHLLFDNETQLKRVIEWAKTHPHTGSRKDYWPHLYNDVHEGLPGTGLSLQLQNCGLKKGAVRLYSPKLEMVWNNVSHDAAEPGDWYQDWEVIEYLKDFNQTVDGEIASEYCQTLKRLELAALAKKTIFI